MNADGLELPSRLVRLIDAGHWPSTSREANRQQGRPAIFAPEVVARIAPTETQLFLYPPPFRTVQRCVDQGEPFWLEPVAAPGDLDPKLAIAIGDFGLGSDAPLVLDYRVDRLRPRVLRLQWRAQATVNRWMLVTRGFDEFCDRLELEKRMFRLPPDAG